MGVVEELVGSLQGVETILQFAIILCRIVPVVSLSALFGGKTPTLAKSALALTLALFCLPQATRQVEYWMIIQEVIVGITLALLFNVPFYIAEMSGVYIDFLRGSFAMTMINPLSQAQSSPIGLLQMAIMLAIAFQPEVFGLFLEALYRSYLVVPIGMGVCKRFLIGGIVARVVAIGLQIAAPTLVGILMAECFLGVANRLAPQVQIAFLGLAIKSLVGLGMMYLSCPLIIRELNKQLITWISEIDLWLQ